MSKLPSRQAALHVLGVLKSPEGLPPGSFTTKLIEAVFAADISNQAKLEKGFPDEVAAVRLYTNVGEQELIKIARGK